MHSVPMVVFVLAMISTSATAQSLPVAVSSLVPNALVRGQATLRVFGFTLYDAELFTPGASQYQDGSPAALRLSYRQSFSRNQLVRTSVEGLSRMEGAQNDHHAIARDLRQCFRDVRKGDTVVAATPKADALELWFNDVKTCSIERPGIARRFLGIWLSDNSRAPKLSHQLRGE